MEPFKVYVVIVGLTLGVPNDPSNPTSVTTILVDAELQDDVYGDASAPHTVTMNRRESSGPPSTLSPGFDIWFKKSCSPDAPCGIDMTGVSDHQPDLIALSGRTGNRVRTTCLDSKTSFECTGARKHPLVKGHVRLEGDWTATSGTACSEALPQKGVESISWDFGRRTWLTGKWKQDSSVPSKSLGNAFIWETEVAENASDLSMRVNGVLMKVEPTGSRDSCDLLGAGGKPCAIFELRNVTHDHVSFDASKEGECPENQDPADGHFSILYSLLEKKPSYRWVPYAKSCFCVENRGDGPHAMQVPASRCGGGTGGGGGGG